MTKTRKRPLRWYIAWTISFIIAAVSLVSLILSIPLWRIDAVEVKGAQMVDELLIKEKASVPIGENIFFVSFTKPTFNLNAIQQLNKFSFKKRLPSKIVIEVEERQPFAVCVIEKEANVIDATGVILKAEGNMDYDFVIILNISDLPVVVGLKRNQVDGYRLAQDVAESINIAISRSSEFLEASSLQLDLSDLKNISILIEDILKVKIGTAENLKQKMDTLETVLADVRGRWNQVNYIDVRYPARPVVKFRE